MTPQPHIPDDLDEYSPLTRAEIIWQVFSPLSPFILLGIAFFHQWKFYANHAPLPPRIIVGVVYLALVVVTWMLKGPWWGKTVDDYANRNTVRYWIVLSKKTGGASVWREIMQTPTVRAIHERHGESYVALPLCPPDMARGFMGFVVLDPDLRHDLDGIRTLNQGSGLRHWEVCLNRFVKNDDSHTAVWIKHWKSEIWTACTVADLFEFASSGLPDRFDGELPMEHLTVLIRMFRNETANAKEEYQHLRDERDRLSRERKEALGAAYRAWKAMLPSGPEISEKRKARHALEDELLRVLHRDDVCCTEIALYVAADLTRSKSA